PDPHLRRALPDRSRAGANALRSFHANLLRAADHADDASLGGPAYVGPYVGRPQDRPAQNVRHGAGQRRTNGAGALQSIHQGPAHGIDSRVNDLARPSNTLDDPCLHGLHDVFLLVHGEPPCLIRESGFGARGLAVQTAPAIRLSNPTDASSDCRRGSVNLSMSHAPAVEAALPPVREALRRHGVSAF